MHPENVRRRVVAVGFGVRASPRAQPVTAARLDRRRACRLERSASNPARHRPRDHDQRVSDHCSVDWPPITALTTGDTTCMDVAEPQLVHAWACRAKRAPSHQLLAEAHGKTSVQPSTPLSKAVRGLHSLGPLSLATRSRSQYVQHTLVRVAVTHRPRHDVAAVRVGLVAAHTVCVRPPVAGLRPCACPP